MRSEQVTLERKKQAINWRTSIRGSVHVLNLSMALPIAAIKTHDLSGTLPYGTHATQSQ